MWKWVMNPVKRYFNAGQGTLMRSHILFEPCFVNNSLSDAAILLRPGSAQTPKRDEG